MSREEYQIPAPKAPGGSDWETLPARGAGGDTVSLASYRMCSLVVVSSVEDFREDGLWWHVSISYPDTTPGRPTMRRVRAVFGMRDAEEDNAASIDPRCRHLWLKVPE